MEDDREALEAFFQDDFEVGTDPRGRPVWRVAMPAHGATLAAVIPEGYPETEMAMRVELPYFSGDEAPRPALEFDPWPVGGDEFAQRIAVELREMWTPGAGCILAWAEHVQEELSSGPRELLRSSAAVGADRDAAADGAARAAGDEAAAGTCSVPLGAGAAEPLAASLEAVGFVAWGPGVYSHGDRGASVEVSDASLYVRVDGVHAEDLGDWVAMQLLEGPGNFGARLVDWIAAERSAEPGFAETEEADGQVHGLSWLPSAQELGVTPGRDLLVYTWGRALRKAAPGDSECNFNAGILNGRGGGADLRTMNGLSDEVQNNVASCHLFPRWISMVCAKVEHSDCKVISINCTKGRHRSVAAAVILQKMYYPQAVLKHLTIY